ncbi:unnamed protein product (macronuclear) [Paramecium tetraurelia]|uniref:CSC1/OSCA1-like cytosolic domain-containing protein n=1 Tax=Paramecium tetraurelia TaxID=5888 RepID=A0CGU7_PARTE|nr:uncharacterized protein GSPATT00007454001 [Paramecium tetraurelia]CAK70014.1 unnamed protein product [Paramecium tetraurelia]|eukprot:XP_001437411.1 hypothetical protein (macronuclear) [Paramecium tetraurelia strain d4-2]
MEGQLDECLKSQNYNLKSPADFEQAQKHGKSQTIYQSIVQDTERCVCCNNPIQTVPYSVTCSLKVFNQHGYSYKYFNYIKLNFILLVLGFLIFGIYNVQENIKGDQCQQHQDCKKNLNNYFSLLNRMDGDEFIRFQDIYLDVLYFIAVLVQICFIGYITYYKNHCLNVDNEQDLEKVIKYCSVKVSQIPINWNREKIQEFFSKGMWEKKPITYNILDICLIYDQYQLEYQLKDKIRQQFTIQNQSTNRSLKEVICKTVNIQSVILDQKLLKFDGSAFITFSNQADLIKFVRYFRWVFIPNTFKFESPPRPSDVIWHNESTFSNLEYIKLLFICFGWLPIIGIQVAKQNYLAENGNTSYQNTLLSFTVSLLLYLLTKFCEKSIQQFFNLKDFNSNRQKRRVFVLFYETIVIQYFYLIPPIFVGVYSGSGTRQQKLWRAGGLSEDLLFIQLLNAIFPIIFSIIDETYALQLIKRYWFRRINKDSDLTQIEADQLYERQLDYQKKRLSITQLVSICCYYGYIYPICYFITIIALIVIYWMEKYNFVRNGVSSKASVKFHISRYNLLAFLLFELLSKQIFHIAFWQFDYKSATNYIYALQYMFLTYVIITKKECIIKKRIHRNYDEKLLQESLKYYENYSRHNPIMNHQFEQNQEEIQQFYRYSRQEKFYAQLQLKLYRELKQEYSSKGTVRIHPTEIVSLRFQEQ